MASLTPSSVLGVPPLGNIPNRGGTDPHGQGRDQLEVPTVATTFLEQGLLVDTCGGGPCQTLPPPPG
jgi:hypothetical protein